MKPILFLVAVLLTATACNKTKTIDDIDPEQLKPVGSEVTNPGYSFAAELDDDCCRFVADMLTLRYNDGGILFSKETEGEVTIYRAVELATGNSAELRLADSPSLLVNGKEIAVKSVVIERENKKGAWINILTPDYKRIVFVVTDL